MNEVKAKTHEKINLEIADIYKLQNALRSVDVALNKDTISKLLSSLIQGTSVPNLKNLASKLVDYNSYLNQIKKDPELLKLIQDKIKEKKK